MTQSPSVYFTQFSGCFMGGAVQKKSTWLLFNSQSFSYPAPIDHTFFPPPPFFFNMMQLNSAFGAVTAMGARAGGSKRHPGAPVPAHVEGQAQPPFECIRPGASTTVRRGDARERDRA